MSVLRIGWGLQVVGNDHLEIQPPCYDQKMRSNDNLLRNKVKLVVKSLELYCLVRAFCI